MAKKKPTSKPPAEDSDHNREVAALKARLAQLEGKPLKRQQERDWAWYLAKQRERAKEDLLVNLPKGVFCELAGRQHKTIDDMAERFELPTNGATVNLYIVIRQMYDWLSEHGTRLTVDEYAGREELLNSKLREEIGKLRLQQDSLEIEISRRRDSLVDRNAVRDRLQWLAGQLQALGKRLARTGGEGAQKTLNEFLKSLAEEIEHGALTL